MLRRGDTGEGMQLYGMSWFNKFHFYGLRSFITPLHGDYRCVFTGHIYIYIHICFLVYIDNVCYFTFFDHCCAIVKGTIMKYTCSVCVLYTIAL